MGEKVAPIPKYPVIPALNSLKERRPASMIFVRQVGFVLMQDFHLSQRGHSFPPSFRDKEELISLR